MGSASQDSDVPSRQSHSALPGGNAGLFSRSDATAVLQAGPADKPQKIWRMVANMEGAGPHARIEVHFAEAGPKWLVITYADLQPI